MQNVLYVKFNDAGQAEKALGALIDRGAQIKDLTAIFPENFLPRNYKESAVKQAVDGITTTTGPDAVRGAEKGAAAGLGVGALAALATLLIPGFGLVTGGSALVFALIGVAEATVGGAVAGGVAGYLQDQGVPGRVASDSLAAIMNGSAVLSIHCPTGKLGEFEVMELVSKYGAEEFSRANQAGEEILLG